MDKRESWMWEALQLTLLGRFPMLFVLVLIACHFILIQIAFLLPTLALVVVVGCWIVVGGCC
jgi:hypothetical protein